MGEYDALDAWGAEPKAKPTTKLTNEYGALDAFGTASAAPARTAPTGYEGMFGAGDVPTKGVKSESDEITLSDIVTGKAKEKNLRRTAPRERESFVRGGLQGASLGFGDELSALIDTGVSKVPGLRSVAQTLHDEKFPALTNPDATYQDRREAYRARNHRAETENPKAYLGGELVGGLAAIPATGGFGEAGTLGQVIKSGAKVGAKLGAVSGVGSSSADLTQGEVAPLLADALKGGATGAVLGGAFAAGGHAVKTFVKGASESIKKFVLKDIVGDAKGASTPTARKNLHRDADDIAELVTQDRPLETALRKASYASKRHLNDALEMVDNRLDTASAPRGTLYGQLDQALPEGGVKSGDVVDFVKKAAKDRLKSGLGYDEGEARELQRIADRLEKAEDWGFRDTLDPKSQQIVDNLARQRLAAVGRGQSPERFDVAIENIRSTAKPSFDRNTIVPSEKLRDLVTDVQKTAFEKEGGINGTERYNRAREVARVPEEFLSKLLGKAARKAPDVVRGIDEHDTAVSALLRVKNVLQQRALNAQSDDVGHNMFGRVVHAIAHPRREIQTMVISGGVRAGVAGRRAGDRVARSLNESDNMYAKMVVDAMTKGLPLTAAVEAAEAAGRAGAD